MDRRYQVFVSSTFDDLREERAAVISALLQIDCFPAGMELFPAADDDSLTLIKSVVDDSDYYLVILAGRYGSLHAKEGKSFTEFLRLRRENNAVRDEIALTRRATPPEGAELLAQGPDETTLSLWLGRAEPTSFTMALPWESIIRVVLPCTYGGGALEPVIINALASPLHECAIERQPPVSHSAGWQECTFGATRWRRF